MIEIALLADHPQVIPTLTNWFRNQWPDYYAKRAPEDIAQDFRAEARRDGLPVRLVAFVNGELAGTICLRQHAIRTVPEYRPGLGGLLVIESHRGQGIGTELVNAGMNVARKQGYATVYATTIAARGILERLGWRLVRELAHEDELLLLFCCEFSASQSD